MELNPAQVRDKKKLWSDQQSECGAQEENRQTKTHQAAIISSRLASIPGEGERELEDDGVSGCQQPPR